MLQSYLFVLHLIRPYIMFFTVTIYALNCDVSINVAFDNITGLHIHVQCFA